MGRKRNVEPDIGIYSIFNKVNNKEYIGLSTKLRRRKSIHFNRLRKNTHPNKYLQNAFNKYGEINFDFRIIEYCNIEELETKEIFWINYNKTITTGYNLKKGGKSCSFVSQETRRKLSENTPRTWKDKKGKDHPNSKKVYQYNLDGTFVKQWYGSAEILRELKIDICRVMCGDAKSAGGFMWRRYYSEKIESHPYININPSCKEVDMFDLDENFIKTFASYKEASAFLNIVPRLFSKAISRAKPNSFKTYYKYKWKSKHVSTEDIKH